MLNHTKSTAAFEAAKKVIPGGVNSPVRSFRSVGGNPPFAARGSGSKLYDLDGNEYIDYIMSYGPLLLGHAPAVVIDAITAAAAGGTSYGIPTAAEVTLAEMICKLVPSMDMVRMVNSGTEATMSAIRLARAYTGRDYIVKFIGCYHAADLPRCRKTIHDRHAYIHEDCLISPFPGIRKQPAGFPAVGGNIHTEIDLFQHMPVIILIKSVR